MNSPTKDLTDYLVSNTSLVMGVDLFAAKLPEMRGTIACLVDTGGTEPEPSNIQNPGLQVLTRADIGGELGVGGYQSAYALMNTILSLLHALSNTTINGTSYIVVWKTTDIFSLGEDKKGRPLLSCNLRIKRS